MITVKGNGELQAFKRCMQLLGSKNAADKRSLRGMVFLATRRLGNKTKELVTRTYVQGIGILGHTPGTRLTYLSGKATGAERSHRMKFPEARPGHRTGTLARHVVVNRIGRFHGHRVEIDPGKRYSGFGGEGDQGDVGKPLWFIAAELEDPRPEVLKVRMTRRMQVYLMLLYSGRADADYEPKSHIMRNYVVRDIIIQRRPRPIWHDTFKKIMRVMPKELDNGMRVDLQRVYKISRKGLGGKVTKLLSAKGLI
jgi:hypothetical protein